MSTDRGLDKELFFSNQAIPLSLSLIVCTLGLSLGWTFSPLAASHGPIVPADARGKS